MKRYKSRPLKARRVNLFLAEKGAEQNDFLEVTGAFHNISGVFCRMRNASRRVGRAMRSASDQQSGHL